MVTADVYDISPDDSAVRLLLAHGIAPWVVDFGSPDEEKGGLERTLDDHVRAVIESIARVHELTGKSVHLCGYCQGGLFAYQAAAFLRCEGVRSIVTFGSPVDAYKGIPGARSDLVEALHRTLYPVTSKVLARVESVPARLVTLGFQLASPKKTLEHRLDFVRSLHDRERTMKHESRRRFLAGKGFVAWPGPALRAAAEDFVVHNRMVSGGFVIDGRTISLADLTCPVLAFVGTHDEIAIPNSVSAIELAAPNADVHLEPLPAGHFGLVIGSRATKTTWPRVVTWISAIEHGASANEALGDYAANDNGTRDQNENEVHLLGKVVRNAAREMWGSLGDVVASANHVVEAVRWQERRLHRLTRIRPDTRISASLELARRAKQTPAEIFFLWRGRAFSYVDADTRVTNVARALHARGVRGGDRIGVLMTSRPSLLSAVVALGRLGATAVVAPPDAPAEALDQAFERTGITQLIVDPEHVDLATCFSGKVMTLGGGQRHAEPGSHIGGALGPFDLETVDPRAAPLPSDLELDASLADDVAIVLLRPDERKTDLRVVPITNHRWALSALGAAATCGIKPGDTVFCPLPLHHPTGLLVGTGAALAGGARLALSSEEDIGRPIEARRFLLELRRVGATVVIYAGEMLRPLVHDPGTPMDRHLPVRLMAGSGLRPALATELRERFDVDTMEFYASTTHTAVLADPMGDEPGALGGVLPGSSPVCLVKCDLVHKRPLLDEDRHLIRAGADEPGILAVGVSNEDSALWVDPRKVTTDAFGDGTSWLVTGDVLERDSAGGYWFVDALSGFFTTKDGHATSTRRVEDALYTIPEIELAAVWEEEHHLVGAFVSREPIPVERIERALSHLPADARPTSIERVPEIPLTAGFRPDKLALRHR
jgi:putative long chain acyl-CoA synthase